MIKQLEGIKINPGKDFLRICFILLKELLTDKNDFCHCTKRFVVENNKTTTFRFSLLAAREKGQSRFKREYGTG